MKLESFELTWKESRKLESYYSSKKVQLILERFLESFQFISFVGYLGFELEIMTMDNIKGQKKVSIVVLLGTSH